MNARAQMKISRVPRPAVLWFLVLGAVGWIAGCGGDGTKPPQAPVVRLMSPNGGESLYAGSIHQVMWTATDADTPGASLLIDLLLSIDNGATWYPLASNEVNDGQYDWTIPSVSSAQVRMRVAARDGQATSTDDSDAIFALVYSPPPPPERSVVTVGDGEGARLSEVTVGLALDNPEEASAFETVLSFDDTKLEFVRGVAIGRGLGFPFTTTELTPEQVRIRFAPRNGQSFDVDTSRVALITFRLVGEGGAEATVSPGSTELLDTDGLALSVNHVAGTITIVPGETPEGLTEDGWALFEQGNYAGAAEKFDSAIVLDAAYGPAYTGLGWSRLQPAVGTAGFQAAREAFEGAIARQQTLGDARGGRAAALLALGGTQLPEAATEAARAYAASPSFSFEHRTSFDLKDLYLLEAFAEAGRGRVDQARVAADRITPSGLRSDAAGTWIVDGITYATYEGAVLAFLQKMSNQHAG